MFRARATDGNGERSWTSHFYIRSFVAAAKSVSDQTGFEIFLSKLVLLTNLVEQILQA